MIRQNAWLLPAVLSLAATAAWASTTMPEASEEDVILQGTSIVYGYFTGRSETEIKTYRDMLDDEGHPIEYAEVITVLEFQVKEWLDGEKTPESLRVRFVGGDAQGIETPTRTELPEPEVPVVLSLLVDSGEGYLPVHGRVFEMRDPGRLEAFSGRVKKLRFERRGEEEDDAEQEQIRPQGPDSPAGLAAIRRGGSVVYGAFTGRAKSEQSGDEAAVDDEGRPVEAAGEVTWFELQVFEVLDGAAVDDLVWVRLPGAVLDRPGVASRAPASAKPVVLSLVEEGEGSFAPVDGRIFADPGSDLSAFKKRVRELRSPRSTEPGEQD